MAKLAGRLGPSRSRSDGCLDGALGPQAARVERWSSSDRLVALAADEGGLATRCLGEGKSIAVAFAGYLTSAEGVGPPAPGGDAGAQSAADTILNLYARHGTAAFTRIKGAFAIAVVDQLRGEILLVRDPMGAKALYLGRWSGKVWFGSCLSRLAAASGDVIALNPEARDDFWTHGFVMPYRTSLEKADPILPGHVVVLDMDGACVRILRCTPEVDEHFDGEPFAEAKLKVQRLLRQALVRLAPSGSKRAVLLSGGIDSTLVCQETARQGDGPEFIRGYTLGQIVPFIHDEFYARYAARRLAISLQVVDMRSSRIDRAAEDFLTFQDEPLEDISYLPYCRLCADAAQENEVVLTGDLTPVGLFDLMSEKYSSKWIFHSRTVCTFPLPPEWLNRINKENITNHMVGKILRKVEAASASIGPGRSPVSPFIDWDLVAYARSLPATYLCRQITSKPMLKSLLDDWPKWFIESRKRGFTFNLRWAWAWSNFQSLRAAIDDSAIAAFAHRLPKDLAGGPASSWSRHQVFRDFRTCWRLAVWSAFLRRLGAGGKA